MIRSLIGQKHIEVESGYPSSTFYQNNANPMSGMVRYVNNYFEAYDGTTWHRIDMTSASIKLSKTASEAIDWAIKQIEIESNIEALGQDNLAIKAAHDNFKRASEQLKTTIILSKDQEQVSPWEKLQAHFP